MRVGAVFLAGLAALVLAAPASADTWTVTNGSSDATTRCDFAKHECVSLRAALAASEETKEVPDTINVPAGTININNDLVIQSDITVVGTSARTNIIDGGGKYRGFRVTASGNAKIGHFTVRNGAAGQGDSLDGGGILNFGGVVVLDHVRVTGSRAPEGSGGGIANVRGNLLLQHSLVDNNTAGDGGGIAGIGGPEVPDQDFLLISDSTVFRNTTGTGGTGGVTSRNGGSLASLARVTIADNVGGTRGVGGISRVNNGTLQIGSSIVARNIVGTASANCGGTLAVTDAGANVESDKECDFDVQGATAGLAAALSNQGGEVDVLAITAASPAVDRGPLSSCNAAGSTDARKKARPQGPGCDSGAFELDVAPTVTITSGPTGTINASSASFAFTSTEPGVSYQCRLTGPGQPGAFAPCASPGGQGYSGLGNGSYTFSVRALDGVFTDPPIASRAFTVELLDTTITGGPSGATNDTTPEWTFIGAGGAAGFECSLDGAAFAGCNSPFTAPPLSQGTHTFAVRALSVSGAPDPTPATRTITVDTVAPTTTITGGPTGAVSSTSATFTFTSNEGGVTFQCSLDGAAFGTCPASYTGLAQGAHSFRVRARDAAGNTGAPATRNWTVDTVAPDTALTPITTPTGDQTPQFTFASNDGGATFQCRVDGTAFAPCSSPHTTAPLDDGEHTFNVRAVDAAGNVDPTPAAQSFVVDAGAPDTTITAGPEGATNDATPTFAFSATEAGTFECRVGGAAFAACTSPHTTAALAEGAHTFEVRARDALGNADASPATRAFTLDLTPPPAPQVVSGPEGPTTQASPAFEFAASEIVSCRLDGPGAAVGEFGACASPKSFGALAPGDYVFVVRAVDAAGNATETRRAFTVTAPQAAQPTPTPTPTATPTPTPTPSAQSVVVAPAAGTVLVRVPGSRTFALLDASQGIPFGSEVDARKGRVRLTALPTAGKPPETADFYDGLFTIHKVGGFIELRLSEKLTGCPKARKSASAAQKKPKSRKLWGDGKGKFRTRGSYSAATVRGTKWLVQDSCTTTLTRVTQGVVQVRDFVKRKNVLVKKGKRYTARAKKR